MNIVYQPKRNEENSILPYVRMMGLNPERIMQAIKILDKQDRGNSRTLRQVYDYSMPNVSEKVVRIILSYSDYVNGVILWKAII